MTIKLSIYLPIPAVKTLSLGGGGARGAVYGPVLKYLEDAKIMSGIEEVYGVSAGAITSNLLAFGATGDELIKLTNETNFKTLLKNRSFFKGGKGIFYTDTLKAMVVKQGSELFLKRIQEARMRCKQDVLGQELLKKLDALEGNINQITFRDLENLKTILTDLGHPGKVKSLSVLAVNTADGKPYLFSHLTHPDVIIADAVVASCSIPPIFKPHQVTVNDKKMHFVDGGLHRSLLNPTHQVSFKSDVEKRLDSMQLLLLPSKLSKSQQALYNAFSGEGSANTHIYDKYKPMGFIFILIGYLAKFIFGANGIVGRHEMQKSVKEYGHNVVSMDVNISPNDFGLSLENKQLAGEKAVASLKEYLQERRQPEHAYMLQGPPSVILYQVPFDQFDEAVNQLTTVIEDKKKTIEANTSLSQDEKKHQLEELKAELTAFNMLIPQIKSHRTLQSQLENQIITELKTSLEHVSDKTLIMDELATLQDLMHNYLKCPDNLVDLDAQLSTINNERLFNGTHNLLEQLYIGMKEKGVVLTEKYEILMALSQRYDEYQVALKL